MEIRKMIDVYLEYCESKQLRPRTIGSYRQALELFAVWLKESEGIEHIEDISDATIRRYRTDGRQNSSLPPPRFR